MKTSPSLKQLYYLMKLHETKNFRQAAELCYVTQPTLSAAIQEMENLLGLPVLDRSQRKKVIFTSFGLEVVKTAKNVLPLVENLSDKAKMMAHPLSGPLRIGFIPTIAPYLIPYMLPDLQKKFPKLEFEITEDVTEQLIQKLHEGLIDLAILAFPCNTMDLKKVILFEEPFYCAAPKNLFKKKKLEINDLKNQEVLLLEDGHCLREHAMSACKLMNTHGQKSLSATSLQTLIQIVDQGYGITLLPEMVVKKGFIPGTIDIHAFQEPVPTRKIGVAWRKKDPLEKDISVIIDRLGAILS
jgi:LysR family hydrogen peroxide-inducible transcriptional activator